MLVSETFEGISGEGRYAGYPALFIRLSGCTRECSFCFVKNTNISTPQKIKNIQDLKIGDEILSYNFETKQTEKDIVKNVFKREVDELIRIKLERTDFKEGNIFVTPEHLFYTTKRGWVAAKDLELSDEIYEHKLSIQMIFNNPRKNMSEQMKLYLANIVSQKNKGLKRSKESIERYRKAKQFKPTRLFGENNPNWRGGIEGSKYTHHLKEWKNIRIKILERDKKCLLCEEERDLVVHHIDFNTSNNILENLCCLCRKCNSSINHGRFEFKPIIYNGAKIRTLEKINRQINSKAYVRLAGLLKNKIIVYNIETENNNYFVNRVLVHNCDTKYHNKGEEVSIEAIIDKIRKSDKKIVIFTGGEPLLQLQAIKDIMKLVPNKLYHLESNGDLIKNLKEFNSIVCFSLHEKTFDYVSFSPKDKKVAKRLSNFLNKTIYKECFDIKIVTDLNINKNLIPYATMLMPLTYYDEEVDKPIRKKVWEYCLKNNIRYTPRLQVEIFGNERGK